MMKMFKHMTALAVLAGAALAATPAAAAGVVSPDVKPVAKVTILKPLVLTKKSDLDFGTILLPASVSGTLTVKVTQGGVMTCTTGLTCAATAASVGGYNVTGTNKAKVLITAPDVVMNNSSNTGTITVKLDAPASVTMTSSGSTGDNFAVGGSFDITSSTTDGVYSGDMNVTVDYQ